jgi:hypothetical protein
MAGVTSSALRVIYCTIASLDFIACFLAALLAEISGVLLGAYRLTLRGFRIRRLAMRIAHVDPRLELGLEKDRLVLVNLI